SVRRGFTLLEIALVLFLLVIILVLIATAMSAMLKIDRADAAAFARMTAQGNLAEQFREDVAGASDVPAQWDKLAAGPGCLIPGRPGGHVIYRWDQNRLQRIEAGAAGETRRPMPVGKDCTGVEFSRAGAGRLITLKLLGGGSPRRPPIVL